MLATENATLGRILSWMTIAQYLEMMTKDQELEELLLQPHTHLHLHATLTVVYHYLPRQHLTSHLLQQQ